LAIKFWWYLIWLDRVPLIQWPVRCFFLDRTETSRALDFVYWKNQVKVIINNHRFIAIALCLWNHLYSMAMRSALSRGTVTRSMDSTSRGAFTRFFSDKGRVLSEEEQAKENVYIQVLSFSIRLFLWFELWKCWIVDFCFQKWEREKLEKQKQEASKARAEKHKDAADSKVQNFACTLFLWSLFLGYWLIDF
jgi:hypothetical protein